jgi:hypothetical protein
MNSAARKEFANLFLADSSNIWISWIVDVKAVPEDKALRLKHAEHLRRLAASSQVENRTKNSEPQGEVKLVFLEFELTRISQLKSRVRRNRPFSSFYPAFKQIDSEKAFGTCTPFNELQEAVACTTALHRASFSLH